MTQKVVYVGERSQNGAGQVFVEVYEANRLLSRSELPHIVKHSPSGLEWGYSGSGPADLANSIVAHVTELRRGVSPALYQPFKSEIVSRLDQGGFRLNASRVRTWLAQRWKAMDEEAIRADLRAA